MTNAESPTVHPQAPAMTVSQYGKTGTWMVVRGVLGIVLGLATAFWPREMVGGPTNLFIGVRTADYLIAAFLVLQALSLLFQARVTPARFRTQVLGQAIVVIPALIFLLVAQNAGQLRAAVCVWALLHGALELWLWAQMRALPNAQDFLIAGAVHVLLGIILLAGSQMHALSVAGFAGSALLIVGVFYCIGGFTRRSRLRTMRDSGLVDTDEALDTDLLAAEELLAIQARDTRDGEVGFEPHGRVSADADTVADADSDTAGHPDTNSHTDTTDTQNPEHPDPKSD